MQQEQQQATGEADEAGTTSRAKADPTIRPTERPRSKCWFTSAILGFEGVFLAKISSPAARCNGRITAVSRPNPDPSRKHLW